MDVDLKDFPKASTRVIKSGMKVAKKFRVRLSPDGEIKTVTPERGIYKAKARGLGPKTDDGVYKLLSKVYNEGTKDENSHLEFICIYDHIEGPYKGVEQPGYYLHYKFEENPDEEGFTQYDTKDTPQAAQLHRLQAWADVHGGLLDEPIVWNSKDADGIDNKVMDVYSRNHRCDLAVILGEMEDRLMSNDVIVNLIYENGNIKDVQPVDDYEEVDIDDEDSVDTLFVNPDGEDIEEVQETILPPAKTASKAKTSKKNVPVEIDDDL